MDVYWLEQSEGAVPAGNQWLGRAEITVLERLRVPKRRADWRLGRWTAKRAAAAYLQLRNPDLLAAIEVRPAHSGAPEVFVGGQPAELSLSLSHSHGTGFCAIAAAGAQLGCDVEKVAPHSQAFLADYFTAGEQAVVARSDAAERDLVLTLLWSAKESALKAARSGLRSDTRSVTVVPQWFPLLGAEAWYPLAASYAGGGSVHGWWRETCDLIWTVLATPPPDPPIRLELLPIGEGELS